MPEAYIALTPVHRFYLVGCWVIHFTMIREKIRHWSTLPFFLELALLENAVWAGDGIQTHFHSSYYLCYQ